MHTLWTSEIETISRALNGQIYLVGGCVRDFLSEKKPTDTDIATPLPPRQVLSLLKQAGITSRIITLRLGVILVTVNAQEFEITTLRQDIYQGDRFSVRFIDTCQADSWRRDFTINALYLKQDGTVLDFHGGISDLQNHIVRFIGDPQKRLSEDALRGLRYLRFWSLYGQDAPDETIIARLSTLQDSLKQVSIGRRKKEMIKLLHSPRFSDIVKMIDQTKLLPAALNGIEDKDLRAAFKGENND